LPHRFIRSGFVVFAVTTILSGCAQQGNNPWAQHPATPSANNAPPAEAHRPGLVVTDTPAPEVIYSPGSHEVVLSGTSPDQTTFSPISTQHLQTLVTQKAAELRHELDQLQGSTDSSKEQLQDLQDRNNKRAADYYAAVAAISAELQGGTTRGNPILVDRWNIAQQKLNAFADNSGALTDLANDLNNQASRATYLQDATQNAFAISGAVPEDHKKLTQIQDGSERELAAINRLLGKTNDEITHHAAFLQSERANLQTLALGIANGELYGKNLTNSLFRKAVNGDKSLYKAGTPTSSAAPAGNGPAPAGVPGMRKPLVIIRFDRPNVNYEQALYTAVNQALEKYPAARFDLIAVSNLEGNAAELALSSAEARKNGEMVLRSLQDMGLPLDRIRLSAASSKNVLNSEVHLYLQ
jgi:hypothetical protein